MKEDEAKKKVCPFEFVAGTISATIQGSVAAENIERIICCRGSSCAMWVELIAPPIDESFMAIVD